MKKETEEMSKALSQENKKGIQMTLKFIREKGESSREVSESPYLHGVTPVNNWKDRLLN